MVDKDKSGQRFDDRLLGHGDLRDWIGQRLEAGASLTLGWPAVSQSTSQQWIGHRYVWLSHALPNCERVGIVSSQMGKKLDQHGPWFAMLRTAATTWQKDPTLLVSSSSAAGGSFIRHGADFFDLPLLEVVPPVNEQQTVDEWLATVREQEPDDMVDSGAVSRSRYYLSPVVKEHGNEERGNERQTDSPFYDLPLVDRAIALASDQLRAFAIRRGGAIESILRQRLRDDAWPTGHTFVGIGSGLTPKKLTDELLAAGAVGWYVYDAGEETAPRAARTDRSREDRRRR